MTTSVAPRSGEILARLADQEVTPENQERALQEYNDARDAELRYAAQKAAEQAAAEVSKMLADAEVARPVMGGERSEHYNAKAPGAALDGIFNTAGEFYQAIWPENQDADLRDKFNTYQNALRTTDGGDGGYLVPEEMRNSLEAVALESTVVRPRAVRVPMGASRVKQPVIDSTSNASSVFGGLTTYWTSEEAAVTESTPKFGEVVLDANKLTVYATATREMLQDSAISVEGILNSLVPQALAHAEDVKFIRGTGAGEPLGFLNAGSKIEVAKRSGQAADTIVWENLVDMYSRLLPGSASSAVWVAHPNTFPELATMALSVGTGGSAIWLQNGAAAPPLSILGRPVIFSEKMSTLGDAGDIALVDFNYYMVGDRQQLTAEVSRDFLFSTDKVAYKFIQRLDGRPSLLSAITPNQGSTTLSAFITLAARA